MTMNHEQSLANDFRDFMKARVPPRYRFHSFSLDGQDRDAGADYLLTDASRFALIEFKWCEQNLASEKAKKRRLKLCRQLAVRRDMRALHDLCHFIAWSDLAAGNVLKMNVYRHEICCKAVFGTASGLLQEVPMTEARWLSGAFARDFFREDGGKSLSLTEFEAYLQWVLTETSDSTKTTLELISYDPTDENMASVRLNSIAEARDWVRDHIAPAPPRGLRPPR